ncbi:MAG: hypothetical protein WED00_00740 [Aquisalimonadaceae bacterium]
MAIGLPFVSYDMFVRDIYGPLHHGDPVVRVNYTYFAVPAMMLGSIFVLIMLVLAQIHRLLHVPLERIMPAAKWCMKGACLSLGLLFLLLLIGGRLTEQVVRSQGYSYCEELFELGVATFSRGYVNDPRMCVSRFELESSLERYGYTDALRRYRFDKEP